MRSRLPLRMRTSRCWLNPRTRTGGSAATQLACACASTRQARPRVWAISGVIAAGLADAPEAAIATRTDGSNPDRVSAAADGRPAAGHAQGVADPESLRSSTGVAAS